MAVLQSLKHLFRYEILGVRPIGKGGCGHIWKAIDLLSGRPVAIKTIAEDLMWQEPMKAKRSFKKEAMAAARLAEHTPFVARVIDIGTIDDVLFYVMNWMEPEAGYTSIDLSERVGRVSLARAKTILAQICEAVQCAHGFGIVHSDIAPQNILFDAETQQYLLTDFGLLKIMEELLITRGSGSLLVGGRRLFFPREVLDDIASISPASDVFALAITFRVMLEGDTCLNPGITQTPGVIRIKHEGRDAPDQVRQLLTRFVDQHSRRDDVGDFISMLQRIPQ